MTRTEERTIPEVTAAEARARAQEIAFGPILFQATRIMRKNGMLEALSHKTSEGISEAELLVNSTVSPYGYRVLIDIALTADIVWERNGLLGLTKTGYMLAHDEMTRVNMDFVADVCYDGMADLETAINEGRPAGLRALGPWPTVYEGLAHLPAQVRKSWFDFDNHYSDRSYPEALALVFRERPRVIMDVGANNGKWSMACLRHDAQVRMITVDLPGQLRELERNVAQAQLSDRVTMHPANMLDPATQLPSGADVIWMSQFLDCFGEDEIIAIISKARDAMTNGTVLYIMETFIDRQKYPAAAFCLAATSLYFTAIANGNSRMYRAEHFEPLVERAGMRITERIDNIGMGHSILRCVRA